MFSELPKLFDRDFAIGYFLPMVCFLGALYGVFISYHIDLMRHLEDVKEYKTLIGTGLIGLFTWLGGVALVAGNRSIYKIFEGYFWPHNTSLGKLQGQKHFERLLKQIDNAYITADMYRSKGEAVPRELLQQQADLLIARAEHFPYREQDVLATKFGNTIRAFETYPKAMYGIDAIEGWLRLLAVVPKDYRQLIDSAKAQTDFWLNLWFLSYIIAIIYILLSALSHQFIGWFFVLFPVVVLIAIARTAAITAAKEWGATFKAAFDVFIIELSEKLHFSPNMYGYNRAENDPEDDPEWQQWDAFSRAITYRDPSQLPIRQSEQKGLEQQKKSHEEDTHEDASDETAENALDAEDE